MDGIGRYFAKVWDGGDFVVFGKDHLVFIIFVLLINISFIWMRRIKSEHFRRNMRWGMAFTSIFVELPGTLGRSGWESGQ